MRVSSFLVAFTVAAISFNGPLRGLGAESAPIKVQRYADHLVEKYDTDGDSDLQAGEWQAMQGNPAAADDDGDGVITRDELTRHIADYGRHRRIRLLPGVVHRLELPPLLNPEVASGQEPAIRTVPPEIAPQADALEPRKFIPARSRSTAGLPAWFAERDRDGDGQLTLAEFIADGAAIADFEPYDRNQDGILTAAEFLRGPGDVPEPAEPADPEPAVEPALDGQTEATATAATEAEAPE